MGLTPFIDVVAAEMWRRNHKWATGKGPEVPDEDKIASCIERLVGRALAETGHFRTGGFCVSYNPDRMEVRVRYEG